jgi:hypothetical protein
MRMFLSAIAMASLAFSGPAAADYGHGDWSNQGYGELEKIEREYREKFAKERQDCEKNEYEAKNRQEWAKAERECDEKLAKVEREYRQKIREERAKIYRDGRY